MSEEELVNLEHLIDRVGLADVLDMLSGIEEKRGLDIGLANTRLAFGHYGIAKGLQMLQGMVEEL